MTPKQESEAIQQAKRIISISKLDISEIDVNVAAQAIQKFYTGDMLNDIEVREAIRVLTLMDDVLRRLQPYFYLAFREVRYLSGQFEQMQEIRSRKC